MAVLPTSTAKGTVSTTPTTTSQAAATNPALQVASPANVSPNSAYGIQARQALNNMGVDNNRIGYNNGYVTVDGQNIFRPGANQNGTAYVNQAMLNSAMGQINQLNTQNKLLQTITNPQAAVNPYDTQITQQLSQLQQPAAVNPYDNQIADVLAQLTQRINNPAPYDPYSSAEYAAQQAAAQRNADATIRQTQESLGSAGLGRSSILADRAQRTQNDANEYMQLQVVPQLIAANQAQQQQQLANLSSLVSSLSGQQGVYDTRAQNDRSNGYNILEALMNQQGVTDTRNQNQFNNAFSASDFMNKLAQQNIENQRNTRNDNLNAANMVSQLTGRVVNPQTDWTGLYRQAANSNTPLTADQQNTQFNQQYQLEQLAYQKTRDSISDQQWKAKFDEDVRQYGLSYAMQQLSRTDDNAYRKAQLALSQDDNDRAWLAYEDSLNTGTEAKYSGMTANQVYDAVRSSFTTDDPKTGAKIFPTDAASKEKMYQQVMSSGLPDGQDTQVLSLLGLTSNEIASYDKKYGVSGN